MNHQRIDKYYSIFLNISVTVLELALDSKIGLNQHFILERNPILAYYFLAVCFIEKRASKPVYFKLLRRPLYRVQKVNRYF